MQLGDGHLVSSDLNDLYLFVIRRKMRMLSFLDVIEKVLLGTIFHEHHSYHSIKPLKSFLNESKDLAIRTFIEFVSNPVIK
jgi:hypothetical protein